MTTSAELPLVLFIEDMAKLLGTSVRTIRRLRQYRAFPIPELDGVDRKPRWSREVVLRYLAQETAGGRLRRVG